MHYMYVHVADKQWVSINFSCASGLDALSLSEIASNKITEFKNVDINIWKMTT